MAQTFARNAIRLAALLILSASLAACGGGGGSVSSHGGNVRLQNGIYKVGDPYQVAGRWYYPAEQPNYNETGIASWYGPQFHGHRTANGEVFDQNLFSAAHPTLPLPSHVRVTNLENGRSVVVRVNDRGPFAHNRLIDMSRAAARELGFEQAGTARVRVQVLGTAPTNVANSESRAVLEGRRTRNARSAETPTVQAASLTPPGAGGSTPQVTGPTRNLSPSADSGSSRRVATSTQLYVQVGAFGLEDNATRLLSTLRSSGGLRDAMIEPSWVNGEQIFRVRVGPYSEVRDADAALARVANLGYSSARIVVD